MANNQQHTDQAPFPGQVHPTAGGGIVVSKLDDIVNWARANEAISTGPQVVAAACPFCNTMLTDGVKAAEKEGEVQVLDVAELVLGSM